MRWGLVCALGLLIAGSGCWIVAGLEERSISTSAGAIEGGAPADGATAGEGGFPGDGAPAAPPPYCATIVGADFCDAFDIGPLSSEYVVSADAFAKDIAGEQVLSPPGALRIEIPLVGDGLSLNAQLTRTVSAERATARAWTLEASVYIVSNASAGADPVKLPVVLGLGAVGVAIELELARTAGATGTLGCVHAGTAFRGGPKAITLDAYHRVKLRIAESTDLVLTCDIDGQSQERTLVGNDTSDANALLRLGVRAAGGQSALTVYYDDVVYRAE